MPSNFVNGTRTGIRDFMKTFFVFEPMQLNEFMHTVLARLCSTISNMQ